MAGILGHLFGRPNLPQAIVPYKVLPWVEVGNHRSVDELYRFAAKIGNPAVQVSSEIVNSIHPTRHRARYRPVLVRHGDLGLSDSVSRGQVVARGHDLGLKTCPAEVGMWLPLSCRRELMAVGANILTVMDPVIDHRGSPCVIGFYFDGFTLMQRDARFDPEEASRSDLYVFTHQSEVL